MEHGPTGAIEPLSPEGLAEVRAAWGRYGAPATGGRLLATVDAKDAEIERLRAALREIAAPDPEGYSNVGDLQRIAREVLGEKR